MLEERVNPLWFTHKYLKDYSDHCVVNNQMHSDVIQSRSCVYIVCLMEHNYKIFFSFSDFYLSSLKPLEFELGNVRLQIPRDLASYRLEVDVFFKDKTIYCTVYIKTNVFCKVKSIYYKCTSYIFAPDREFYHQIDQIRKNNLTSQFTERNAAFAFHYSMLCSELIWLRCRL